MIWRQGRLVWRCKGAGLQWRGCFHEPGCNGSRCVHVAVLKMSLNTVGTTLSRTLWIRGSSTPSFPRSNRVNRLSSTCRVSGESKQGRDKTTEQSCGTRTDRPSDDVPSTDPPHRCTAADKKRPKEPLGSAGGTGVRRRSFTSRAPALDQKSYLWARYNETKRLVHGKQKVPSWSPSVPHV